MQRKILLRLFPQTTRLIETIALFGVRPRLWNLVVIYFKKNGRRPSSLDTERVRHYEGNMGVAHYIVIHSYISLA